MMSGTVVGVRIELRGIQPKIWRRVVVPVSTTLGTLHKTIQVALGWENYHLWDFKIHREFFGPSRDVYEMWSSTSYDANEFNLAWVIRRGIKRFRYIYDYGDDWDHDVILGKARKVKKSKNYPILVGGARNCPPEDIGGVYGYYRLIEALQDPSLRREDAYETSFYDWYDPEKFEAEVVRKRLKRIHIESRGYTFRIEGD